MTQTPLTPSLIARVTQAARYIVKGDAPTDWFGPMEPPKPLAPDSVTGRRFDYTTGYNLNSTPRANNSISFDDLRALADNCDILRSVIETRKDQMEALKWRIRVSENNAISVTSDQQQRIQSITQFLKNPDKENGFSGWLRQILEDMFVIDAACIYKRPNKAGGLYALEIIDGATIKILIDDSGRLPLNPLPAYQQVLKGVTAVNYTREELIYLKHNPRSHKVYGYSHVEQVMITVNILIRRALHQLEYYRDGSQPDAFIGLPKEWNQEQIVAFQKHFDAMLAGNSAMRRRLRFMPGDFKYQETKAPPLKDAYDEFLARIICYVFSISPEPFVSHSTRATAQISHERGIDEGLAPLQRYVSDVINRIITEEFNSPDLEFAWQDAVAQDPAEAAKINVAYVQAGILSVAEVRESLGLAEGGKAGRREIEKAGIREVKKYNAKHKPAGSAEGGQFDFAEGAGDAGSNSTGEDSTDTSDVTDAFSAIGDVISGLASVLQDALNNIQNLFQTTQQKIESIEPLGQKTTEAVATESNTGYPLDMLQAQIFLPFSPISGIAAVAGEGATAAGEAGAVITGDEATATIEEMLMPNGQRIGTSGSSSVIREVKGDAKDAQKFFDQLTQGGKVIEDLKYNGIGKQMPNGDIISIRTGSTKSPGTNATIDVKSTTINIKKIKFNP